MLGAEGGDGPWGAPAWWGASWGGAKLSRARVCDGRVAARPERLADRRRQPIFVRVPNQGPSPPVARSRAGPNARAMPSARRPAHGLPPVVRPPSHHMRGAIHPQIDATPSTRPDGPLGMREAREAPGSVREPCRRHRRCWFAPYASIMAAPGRSGVPGPPARLATHPGRSGLACAMRPAASRPGPSYRGSGAVWGLNGGRGLR